MKASHCLVMVVALLVFYTSSAFSLSTHSVLADTDNNPATGCSVLLPASNQTLSGIERRLVATTDGIPEQVLAVSIESCNGTAFNTPQPVTGNLPYPVGIDPIDNSSAVELAIETSAIAQPGDTIRFYFVKQTATDDDLLDLTLVGTPILFSVTDPLAPPTIPAPPSTPNPATKIPTTNIWGFILLQGLLLGAVIRWRRTQGMRFFLLACLSCTLSIALAAGFVTDGQIDDWLGENPVAIDPAGDAATDADLLDCYIAEENATLFFRCDTANATTSQDSPPVAVTDTATLLENTAAITINVLSNDTDTDAGPIAIIAVTQPANGTVFVTNNGADLTYQPNANFCNDGTPTDDFTYTLTPGGSTTIVNITVTCGNNPPVVIDEILDAVDDEATVNENSGANAITVLNNDTGESLTINTVTQGSNGAVSITGVGSGLSYTPNANFNGTDTFTYSISNNTDSDTATVSITITSINDNPTALDDLTTVAEDSAATSIAVLSNDSFAPDTGEILSISGVTQGANGVVVITGSGSGLTYMPDADFNGSDTFTYTLSDGNGGTDTGTVGVTVTPINDGPSANLQMLTVNEDATLPITLTASDIDANDLVFATSVTPTNGNLNSIVNQLNTGTTDSATVTYTPNPNFNGTDSFSFQVDDGNGGTNIAIINITVNPAQDTPSANPMMLIVNEDIVLPITLAGSDADGDDMAFTITQNPPNGSLSIIVDQVNTGTTDSATITYTPNANFNGVDSFTFQVDDGQGNTNTASVDITVNAINDAPTIDAIADPAAILEDAVQQTVNLSGIAADSNETQTLTVTASSSNTALIPDPTVTYSSPATTGSLAYTPVANQSGTAVITVTVMDDGNTANGGMDTTTEQFTVIVTAVNDTPAINLVTDPAAILENALQQAVNLSGITAGIDETQSIAVTATSSNTALIPNPIVTYTSPATTGSLAFTPVANQSGTAVITVTVQDDGGTANGAVDTTTVQFTVTVTSINKAPTIDAIADPTAILENAAQQSINLSGISAGLNETQTLTVTASSNNIALIPNPSVIYTSPAATGSLAYTPVATQSGTAVITVTVQDDGLTANGGVDTTTQQFTVTVTAVNDPPTVSGNLNAFDVIGNVSISVPQNAGLLSPGITVNDPDSVSFSVSGGPGAGVSSFTSTNAGNVTITNTATGTFTYNPPAGFEGADSFSFVVCDNGVPAPTMCSSSVTVNLTVADMIWFIDENAAAGGDGRLSTPFNDVAVTADSFDVKATDAVTDNIFLKQGTYTGGLTLLDNQRLVGDGSSTTLAAITGITIPTHSVALPIFSNNDPVINSTSANNISLATNNTIRGVTIGNASDVSLQGANFGTLALSETSIANSSSGEALDLITGNIAATFDSVVASPNSNRSGIELDAITGNFAVLGGTINKSGTSGSAVDIGGNTNGSGGSAVISIGTTLNNIGSGTSRSALIQELNGGSVTLSGNINDVGAGLSIQGTNNGAIATVNISGTSKIFNTGILTAVDLGSNAGNANGIINFTNGGLDIDTTSAIGFIGSNGGTINVTGVNNTITTTTGMAVNISNTTIGAASITFQSVSSNGAANAISINNTGTSGGFAISGDAGSAVNGSGGTISNISANAIQLTNTMNFSMDQVNMNTVGDHGIQGILVNGISVTNGTFTTVGDSNIEDVFSFDRDGQGDNGLTGSALFQNLTITNFLERGIDIVNEGNGTLDLDIINVSMSNNSDTLGDDAIRVQSEGSINTDVLVSSGTYDNVEFDVLQYQALGTGTNNVVVAGVTSTNGGGPDNNPNGGGIAIIGSAGSATSFNINSNNLSGVQGSVIDIIGVPGPAQTVTMNGTIGGAGGLSNTLSSDSGDVIDLDFDGNISGSSTINVTIDIQNNTINFEDDGIGIDFRDAAATGNITVRNNTLNVIAGNDGATTDSDDGIFIFSDDDTTFAGASDLNVAILNNSFAGIDILDKVVVVEDIRDAGRSGCFDIMGNSVSAGSNNIELDFHSVGNGGEVTQASVAEISTDNGSAIVTIADQPPAFNSTNCTSVPLP